MTKYIRNYIKERYDRIYIRKDVIERLRSLLSSENKTYSELLNEMIDLYIKIQREKN
jgi:hypothetical protein